MIKKFKLSPSISRNEHLKKNERFDHSPSIISNYFLHFVIRNPSYYPAVRGQLVFALNYPVTVLLTRIIPWPQERTIVCWTGQVRP